MQEYRVYLLGGDDKISGACWVEAASRDAAVQYVRGNLPCPCEIWDGAERVARIGTEMSEQFA